jgi:hypothetical protein
MGRSLVADRWWLMAEWLMADGRSLVLTAA